MKPLSKQVHHYSDDYYTPKRRSNMNTRGVNRNYMNRDRKHQRARAEMTALDYRIDENAEQSYPRRAVPSVVRCSDYDDYNHGRSRRRSSSNNCLLRESSHSAITLDSIFDSDSVSSGFFSSNSSITTRSTLDTNTASFADGNNLCNGSLNPPEKIMMSPSSARRNRRPSIRRRPQPPPPHSSRSAGGSSNRSQSTPKAGPKKKYFPNANPLPPRKSLPPNSSPALSMRKSRPSSSTSRKGVTSSSPIARKKKTGLVENRFQDTSHNKDDNKLMSLQLKALRQQLKRTEAILMQSGIGGDATSTSNSSGAATNKISGGRNPYRRSSLSFTPSTPTTVSSQSVSAQQLEEVLRELEDTEERLNDVMRVEHPNSLKLQRAVCWE